MLGFWVLARGPTVLLAVAAAIWAKSEDLLREWLSPTLGRFHARAPPGPWRSSASPGRSRASLHRSVRRARSGSCRSTGRLATRASYRRMRPLVAAAVAVAALAEELVWRGAVTQLLAERVGLARRRGSGPLGSTRWRFVRRRGRCGRATASIRCSSLPRPAAASSGEPWRGSSDGLVPSILAHALFDWAVLMMFPLWGRHGLPR